MDKKYWYALFVENNKGAGFAVELNDDEASSVLRCFHQMETVHDDAWGCDTKVTLLGPYTTRKEVEQVIFDTTGY